MIRDIYKWYFLFKEIKLNNKIIDYVNVWMYNNIIYNGIFEFEY